MLWRWPQISISRWTTHKKLFGLTRVNFWFLTFKLAHSTLVWRTTTKRLDQPWIDWLNFFFLFLVLHLNMFELTKTFLFLLKFESTKFNLRINISHVCLTVSSDGNRRLSEIYAAFMWIFIDISQQLAYLRLFNLIWCLPIFYQSFSH